MDLYRLRSPLSFMCYLVCSYNLVNEKLVFSNFTNEETEDQTNELSKTIQEVAQGSIKAKSSDYKFNAFSKRGKPEYIVRLAAIICACSSCCFSNCKGPL